MLYATGARDVQPVYQSHLQQCMCIGKCSLLKHRQLPALSSLCSCKVWVHAAALLTARQHSISRPTSVDTHTCY
jgi:hypothetical protein